MFTKAATEQRQFLCTRIIGEYLWEFITEGRETARLRHNDWHILIEKLLEDVKCSTCSSLGEVEHA
jgi:hypothetical protein